MTTLNDTVRALLDERLRYSRAELEDARHAEAAQVKRLGLAQRSRVDLEGIITAIEHTLTADDTARTARHCPECTGDDDPIAWCDCTGGDGMRTHIGPCRVFAHDPADCPTLNRPVADAVVGQRPDPDPAARLDESHLRQLRRAQAHAGQLGYELAAARTTVEQGRDAMRQALQRLEGVQGAGAARRALTRGLAS